MLNTAQARAIPTLVALTVLTLAFTGCAPEQARLAAVLPLTGIDAPYGLSLQRGLEVAQEELRAAGSTIELTVVDSLSDPETAHARAAELYGSGHLAVIGGVSADELRAMAAEAERVERVLLSPSSAALEGFADAHYVYRITPSARVAATQMGAFAERRLEAETAVLVVEERTFARGLDEAFATAFATGGGKVLETLSVPSVANVAAVAERIVELRPDVVYLAAHEGVVGGVVHALRRARFKGEILTTSAFARPGAIRDLGKEASGVLLTRDILDVEADGPARAFAAAYRARFGEEPDLWAAYGYDALHVLARALEGRPSLPSEVRKGLRDGIDAVPGVTGTVQFDERGGLVRYPRIYVVDDDLEQKDYLERQRTRRAELQAKLEKLHDKASQLTPSS